MNDEDHMEECPDLDWFLVQHGHGFEHLSQVCGYADEQIMALLRALDQLEPVADELDDLLMNLGVSPDEDLFDPHTFHHRSEY